MTFPDQNRVGHDAAGIVTHEWRVVPANLPLPKGHNQRRRIVQCAKSAR